jgi:hypothetical protein
MQLVVVGDGPLMNYYRDQAARYRLLDAITFVGRISFEALKQEYATSDVFVYCGLRNSLGIQILEAMAIAERISSLIHNPDMLLTLSKNAVLKGNSFTWSKVVERTYQTIESRIHSVD